MKFSPICRAFGALFLLSLFLVVDSHAQSERGNHAGQERIHPRWDQATSLSVQRSAIDERDQCREWELFSLPSVVREKTLLVERLIGNASNPERESVLGQRVMEGDAVIVGVHPSVGRAAVAEAVAPFHGEVEQSIGRKAYVIRFSVATVLTVSQAIEKLSAKTELFRYVEPNFTGCLNGFEGTPNDFLFWDQWQLHDPSIPAQWPLTTGAGVSVAVVDTGLDWNNPEFSQNLLLNAAEVNGIANFDDDGNGYVDDTLGWDFGGEDNWPMEPKQNGQFILNHGTAVAGVIAAGINDGYEIVGGAPGAKILPVKFTDEDGDISNGDMMQALDYAVSQGVDIINFSASTYYSNTLADIVLEANAKGILIVASAPYTMEDEINPGYQGEKVSTKVWSQSFPSSLVKYGHHHIISVAFKTEENDFKGFHPESGTFFVGRYDPEAIDIAAPGHGIFTTNVTGEDPRLFYGSSAAAPVVTAVAALVLSENPQIEPDQVRDYIMQYAKKSAVWSGRVGSGGSLSADVVRGVSAGRVRMVEKEKTMLEGNYTGVPFAVERLGANGSAWALLKVLPYGQNPANQSDVSFPAQYIWWGPENQNAKPNHPITNWEYWSGVRNQFKVKIFNDNLKDGDKQFVVQIVDSNLDIESGKDKVIVTILDDEDPNNQLAGVFNFDKIYHVGLEGDTLELVVRRDGGSKGQVQVTVDTDFGANNTAQNGVDYSVLKPSTLVWADGDSAPKSVFVKLKEDVVKESIEYATITLKQNFGGAVVGTSEDAYVIIGDVNPHGTIRLRGAPLCEVYENIGVITVEVERIGGNKGAVSTQLMTVPGTASSGSDYLHCQAILEWADGTNSILGRSISIVWNFLDVEPVEEFKVILSGTYGGAELGASEKTIRIFDKTLPIKDGNKLPEN